MSRSRPARRSTTTRGQLRPTLRDVARAAGVSVMTVSNLVRGKSVGEETRKRVETAIARLNYRPNESARSLRLSEHYSVGIVIADTDPAFLNDPFISRMVSGLSNYLSNLQYTLDVQGIAPDRFGRATILSKLGNAALCAILCGPVDLRRQQLRYLQNLGQPVVVFQEVFEPPSSNIAIVAQDDLSGGKQLGGHLSEKGVRSVLFVRPALDWCAVEQREKGLRAVCKKANPRIEVTTVVAASEQFDDVQSVMKETLAALRPDAVSVATDSMAVAALKACEAAGRRVPKDLLVTGFNGFDVWRYVRPSLTTVVSPAYELGQEAGELLIERLRTGAFRRQRVLLPVRLQLGESTETRAESARRA